MLLKNFLKQFKSARFWFGFGAAFVPLSISILFCTVLVSFHDKTSQLHTTRMPTRKEIELGLIYENQILRYNKCTGYRLTIYPKKNIPELTYFVSNDKDCKYIPEELIKYLKTIISSNGTLFYESLHNLPIACVDKNGNIVHTKLRDYFNININIYEATSDSIEEIHPYPEGKEPLIEIN
jgi:hypothetical protein